MIALDWMLFGNGYGMKSPYCDDIFYWLHDYTDSNTRQRGCFYQWIGGFGAQLTSREWRMPKPGTRRRIAGRNFVVFQASRRLLRVEVSWAMVDLPKDIDEANAAIRSLKGDLGTV